MTAATSTKAALRYLQLLDFKIVVTDLARGTEPKAGAHLIEALASAGMHLPVVVYTRDAASVREELLATGATAVLDTPAELIRELQRLRPSSHAGDAATDHQVGDN